MAGKGHPLRDAVLAVSLLSLLPARAAMPDDGKTQAAAWFPWVGLLFGLVGYAIVKAFESVGLDHRTPLLLAAIVLAVWAVLSRFLHWDGLADVADAYWGGNDPTRRLEIMADSHTGAFGATAIALTALLEVSAIMAIVLAPHEAPLLIVPVFSRFSATAAAWLGKAARPGGLGSSVMGRPSVVGLAVCAAALGVAFALLTLTFGAKGIVLGLLGMALGLGVPHLLSLRFGGVTGDVMGASVLLTETLMFVAFALVG